MAKNSVSDWDTIAANNTDVGNIGIAGTSSIRLGDNAIREMMAQIKVYSREGVAQVAQCRLDLDSGSLKLNRFNGRFISINGALEEIPAAGVTLAGTGVTTTNGVSSGPMQYVYAYMDTGTMTLERSTTAYAVDTATGIMTKSGDTSRTLVGAWCASGNDTWSSTAGQGLSWFNRRRKAVTGALTAIRSVNSGSWTELNSEGRVPFISWADDTALIVFRATVYFSTGVASGAVGIGVDSDTPFIKRIVREENSMVSHVDINTTLAGSESLRTLRMVAFRSASPGYAINVGDNISTETDFGAMEVVING